MNFIILTTNGATILPDFALINEIHDKSLTVIDINKGAFPTTTTVLCTRKGRHLTKAARHFIEFIRDIDITQ